MIANIIDILTTNTLHFSVFALTITLILILVTLVTPKFRIILIPVVFALSYVFLALYTFFLKKSIIETEMYSINSSVQQANEGTCSLCSDGTNKNSTLLPIMDPTFNLREVAKNLLLLEDHLFHKGKRCPDCCVKHSLMIDGLLDESKTLDKQGLYTDIIENLSIKCKESLKKLENLIKKQGLSDGNKCIDIAQQLRENRKLITTAMIQNRI